MKKSNPYDALERIFHEPHRLAIMSALCGAVEGRSFNELKSECDLTDGNLSRHLKTLEESGAIKVKKAFVGSRPRTTVHASEDGRESFLKYLKALEAVLQLAADSMGPVSEKEASLSVSWSETIRTLNKAR